MNCSEREAGGRRGGRRTCTGTADSLSRSTVAATTTVYWCTSGWNGGSRSAPHTTRLASLVSVRGSTALHVPHPTHPSPVAHSALVVSPRAHARRGSHRASWRELARGPTLDITAPSSSSSVAATAALVLPDDASILPLLGPMRPPNRYPRHSNVGRSLTHSLSRSSCRGVIERAQSSASLQSGRFERPPPQRLGKAPLCTGDARAVRRRGHVTVGAAAAQTGPRQLRRDCFTHPVCGTPPPCTASPAVTASVSWGHLSPRWRPRWERWNLPR